MDLREVRQSINKIDYEMKQLFCERMSCSSLVAEVKLATDDSIFKPQREKEIYEKYAEDANYLLFIKKVMQISRKHQYSMFIDRKNINNAFEKFVSGNKAFSQGGLLDLELKEDATGEEGLKAKDVLSVIADTSLEIKNLNLDDNGKVRVTLKVEDTEESKYEALVVSYMLYMETLQHF